MYHSLTSHSNTGTDTIRPDAVRCRRTILRSRHFNRHQHVHVFTSTALAKQFATRHVSNRHGVTVLFNMPYAAQFMEQGLTSAFTNANVFTIDGAAISRVFETILDIVLAETLSLILGEKSPSSELKHYIKENGLVTLNIPKSKVSSLPPLSKSDESNTFKATPYTRRNLDLRPKKHARVLTENELLTSSVAPKKLVRVVKNTSRNLYKIRKNVRMTSPLYVGFSLVITKIVINAQTQTQVRKRSRTHRTRAHEIRRGLQTRTHSSCQTSQRFQQSRDISKADEMERRRSRGIW